MATKTQAPATTVAMRIAGEDIRPGDYVAILNEILELPSYLWENCDGIQKPGETVRIRYMSNDAGLPHCVVAICLPFVYTRKPNGDLVTLDTRQLQIVRLDRACGRKVWKELKPKKKRRRK